MNAEDAVENLREEIRGSFGILDDRIAVLADRVNASALAEELEDLRCRLDRLEAFL